MGSFAIDIRKFGQKTEEQAEAVMRKIALELFKRIVQRSPVDTGRFRANNQIDLNTLPGDALMEFDKNGAATIRGAGGKVARYNLNDTIFLYNNVAYAAALEYGHSDQAPQGVYRVSVQDIVTHFEGIARGVK